MLQGKQHVAVHVAAGQPGKLDGRFALIAT